MDTALTLFDLTDLNPEDDALCTRCNDRPATVRVRAAVNLFGVGHPDYARTRYRDAARRVRSGPCCMRCAWQLASAWWGAWQVCPTGVCALWAHTFADPLSYEACIRHHREDTVVWFTGLELAA
jgi:hypothetical protein